MTSSFEEVATDSGLAVEQLSVWIERRWIRPDRSGTAVIFSEADKARLRMIVEFHRDLGIDEEAMPVVLDLLDRLHSARDHLRAVALAVADLPETAQIAVANRLQGRGET